MTPRSSGNVVGARLKVARLLRGMPQGALAKELSVSPAFLCQLEAGTKQPSDIFLNAVATFFDVTPAFFLRPVLDEFRDEECFFRRRRTTPLYARNRVLAHGTLFAELVAELETRVDFPEDNVPTIPATTPEEIEAAAERCRAAWGLQNDEPVASMMRLMENAGVIVTRFDGGTEKIDAFSRAGARRVVVLSSDKSAVRSRFDLGHECGHLVMHVGMDASQPELERQADAFASAVLLPRAGFVAAFPRRMYTGIDWDALITLKKRWKVSVAAMVRRAFDLKLIDALVYQRAYKYMSVHWGGRRIEPLDSEIAHEEPEVIPRALEVLKDAGLSPLDLASELGWSPSMFEAVSKYQLESLPDGIASLDRARAARRRRGGPPTRT
jgi:Zn-dependent peptidase ImmA (M78 family)/transcriptional regulator with XRE-family HTH domain